MDDSVHTAKQFKTSANAGNPSEGDADCEMWKWVDGQACFWTSVFL